MTVVLGTREPSQEDNEAAGILDAVSLQGLACESLCLKSLPLAGNRPGWRTEIDDGHHDADLTGECHRVQPRLEILDDLVESLVFLPTGALRVFSIPTIRNQRPASFHPA